MDDVLRDGLDRLPDPIPQLDERDVDLWDLTTQEKALPQTLSAAQPAEQVRIYQVGPLHATYLDKSQTTVDTEALKTIQEAGYAIIGARTERPSTIGRYDGENKPWKRAAVELKPRSSVSET